MITTRGTFTGGVAGPGRYRRLVSAPGEARLDRTELAPAPRGPGEPLLGIAHLSDLHLCDAQSPARVEFLDRWADPDSPVLDRVGEVGTYRAQEMLTAHVAEAMIRAVNALEVAPVGGRPLDLAILTGDNTDNAQANELAWYLSLLDGGTVRPDSGDPTRYEGVADRTDADPRYWHPDPLRPDLPRSRHGFPAVPGLLDAVRAPFEATGLRLPWLAVHGNHDRLLQGTVPAARLLAVAIGSRKPVGWLIEPDDDTIVKLLEGMARCDPAALDALRGTRYRSVTPDPGRRVVGPAEFVAAHLTSGARPPGHGFSSPDRRYYRFDHRIPSGGVVTLLVLDTVDPHGGWQGSLDLPQFEWLATELAEAEVEQRYVVLAGHHPLATLTNDTVADGAPRRVLCDELAALLGRHRCVVLWLNGHTHRSTITAHRTWWEVTAPSLIDWPQQARIVEIARRRGLLTIATTMLDHAGPATWQPGPTDPAHLAGLSRELAANDWQWRHTDLERHPRSGAASDRNTLLRLPDPWG